jgi:mono/diheme cytochrome c family protein
MQGRGRTAAARALAAAAVAFAACLPSLAQSADPAASAGKGRQLYNSYCARCHGLNMVTPGAAFFDLRTLKPDEHDRFERSVTQGVRAMPAWGSILKPDDIQAIWQYVIAGR